MKMVTQKLSRKKIVVMESRICIDGVWYVREDEIDTPETIKDIEVTFSEECCYENDKYCFVASRIKIDGDEEYYPDIYIDFTDKRSGNRDTWESEYWDNPDWFKGILKNNPESLNVLNKETKLCSKGKNQFKKFLELLVKEKWLEI